jgi:hypothetical protein
VPPLTSVVKTLTYVLNEAAYNPPGDDEGFLHWASGAVHNTNSVLSTQDANGAVIRSLVLFNCDSARDPGDGPALDLLADRRRPCPKVRVITRLPPIGAMLAAVIFALSVFGSRCSSGGRSAG